MNRPAKKEHIRPTIKTASNPSLSLVADDAALNQGSHIYAWDFQFSERRRNKSLARSNDEVLREADAEETIRYVTSSARRHFCVSRRGYFLSTENPRGSDGWMSVLRRRRAGISIRLFSFTSFVFVFAILDCWRLLTI